MTPADKKHTLCNVSQADKKMTKEAIEKAVKGRAEWERVPFEEKAAIFLRAADLLSSDAYRYQHIYIYIYLL